MTVVLRSHVGIPTRWSTGVYEKKSPLPLACCTWLVAYGNIIMCSAATVSLSLLLLDLYLASKTLSNACKYLFAFYHGKVLYRSTCIRADKVAAALHRWQAAATKEEKKERDTARGGAAARWLFPRVMQNPLISKTGEIVNNGESCVVH
jgi:hypothetical protein